MTRPWTLLALAATLVGSLTLLVVDRGEAVTLVSRLVPIFVFVTGMSVVVNISAQVGTFEALTRAVERVAPDAPGARRHVLWAGLLLLAIVVTVFLSLDTTAILLTPLAVAVARRNGLDLLAVSLAVVWLANMASLPLPVSNLTNLLALSGDGFSGITDYLQWALLPALAAIGVAVAAAGIVHFRSRHPRDIGETVPSDSPTADPLLRTCLLTLAVLLPALATPFPYWLSSSIAAVVLAVASLVRRRGLVSFGLVPWSSLLLATTLSTVATAVNVLGGAEVVQELLGPADDTAASLVGTAAAGAVASNLINNIPAFLALEPAVSTPASYLALLIGVNAGPLVTPWASLATLLWHDQLRRAGVTLRWRTFVVLGLVLVPVAVLIPTGVLILRVS